MKAITTLLITILVVSCTAQPEVDSVELKKRDAAVDSPPVYPDANLGSTPGLVTCPANAQQGTECDLSSQYCCWETYTSTFGTCTANGTSCVHNDEHCDGPEDCASGQTCYAHNWYDGFLLHWTVACATTPTDPSDPIMCRPQAPSCPSGMACVQANTIYGDMLSTQYVCH